MKIRQNKTLDRLARIDGSEFTVLWDLNVPEKSVLGPEGGGKGNQELLLDYRQRKGKEQQKFIKYNRTPWSLALRDQEWVQQVLTQKVIVFRVSPKPFFQFYFLKFIFKIFIQKTNSNVLNTEAQMHWGKVDFRLPRVSFQGWRILLISKIGLNILKSPINYTHP